MTKISQLSSIGDSLAIGDQFLIRDIDDAGSPNKSVTVSGITRALADGDATAPALAFAADKNTGIYRAGTDSLAVATNGAGRLFVDATGNVGVGLTPASYAGYSVIGHGSTTGATLEQRVNGILVGSLTTDSQVTLKASTAIPIVFSTNNTERLRITSAGLVGIGTSSPATPLDVVGNIRAVTSATSATTVRIGNTGNNVFLGVESSTGGSNITGSTAYAGTITSNGPIQFSASNGGSVQATLDASGRLGIGVTSPGEKLEINGATGLRANSGGYVAKFLNSASTGELTGFIYDNNQDNLEITAYDSSYALAFKTNNTERMRLDTSGRMLVGTSTASSTDNDANFPYLQLEGVIGDPSRAMLRCNGGTTYYGGPFLYLSRSGGTSNGSKTSVANGDYLGEILFLGADGADDRRAASIRAVVDGTPGSNDMPGRLVFSTTADGASSPTERMRITSAGDVGLSSGLTLGSISPSSAGFYSTAAILGTGAGTNAVKYNTTTGKFTYDTSSRLNKDQIEDCPYGIAEIKLLQPRRYYRIDDQRLEVGFVADEVVGVLPEFVPFGPKSAITGNENDTESIPLGVNYEKLTSVLTAALQEAIGRIEALEAEVSVLKGA